MELAVVKVAEEVDAALVAAEAVDETVDDSKAVTAFRAVAVDAATTTTTTVAVVMVITVEIKARIMEAPFTTVLCPAPSWFPCRCPLVWPQDNRGIAATVQPLVVRARLE